MASRPTNQRMYEEITDIKFEFQEVMYQVCVLCFLVYVTQLGYSSKYSSTHVCSWSYVFVVVFACTCLFDF